MTRRGVWRGRGVLWRSGPALVVVLILTTGLLGAALLTEVGDRATSVVATADEPSIPAPEPALRPADDRAPVVVPAALDRVLGPLATAPQVGTLTGQVLDDATGQMLWERDPGALMTPASTTKLLTATAALLALRPDDRVDTVLAVGEQPDTLVVVPGGDVTMSSGGQSPLFPGAATLDQMADVVKTAGLTPARLVVDPGPYDGQPLGPGWSAQDIGAGNIAPVEPWMTESGRVDPADEYSPRVDQPQLAAGRALGAKLGLPTDAVSVAPVTVTTTRELGRVHSATLEDRLRSMMVHSDNVLAESVCREIALKRTPDRRASFATGTAAVLDTLREKNLDVTGVHMDDCSGMSPGDKASGAVLAGLVRTASAPDATPGLRGLLDALPVAGVSGTLADRYSGPSASGAGWVRAKTGTLTGTSALSGTVTTRDGRTLSFAFLSSGTNPADARPALDRLAAALRDCGCG